MSEQSIDGLFEELKARLAGLAEVDPDEAHELHGEILRWALSVPGAIWSTQGPAAGYLVMLDGPVKDEDAHQTLTALAMVRGVIGVEPVPADMSMHLAREQARVDLQQKLWAALR